MAFPADLMSFKRSKGFLVPSFISPESSDYARQALDAIRSSVGMRRGDIDKKLRNMELGFRYHKVFRAVSLVLQRKCTFEPPSGMDAPEVRRLVFLTAGSAVYRPEDRRSILEEVAGSLGTNAQEIEKSLYADKESEWILTRVPEELDEDQVCRLYNLGLAETILLKCRELTVLRCDSWIEIARMVKFLGLMYRASGSNESVQNLVIDGPLSGLGSADRYGSRFSSLFHWISQTRNWEIEATVSIKQGTASSNGVYKFRLDSSSSVYFPELANPSLEEKKYPNWVSPSASPVSADGRVFFPDAVGEIGGKRINLDFSSAQYLEFNSRRDEAIRKAGILWETVYVLEPRQKKPAGSIYYYVTVDFDSLRSTLERKYLGIGEPKPRREPERIDEEVPADVLNDISRRIEELMPDSDKVVEYIESRGMTPQRILKLLGYKIKWKGLDRIIYR